MSEVPLLRIRQLNNLPPRSDGDYVLYWMTAFRRPFYNFALQRAVEQAITLQKPLLVLETLHCDDPYACDRFHKFIMQGMSNNRGHFQTTDALYYPFIESKKGTGIELLEALAEAACQIVSDDHPVFFNPQMREAAAKLNVPFETVDSNGLLPLYVADKDYPTAYAFRRFLQKTLPGHLFDFPRADPLAEIELSMMGKLPVELLERWPAASAELLQAAPEQLARLPIDHQVAATEETGGWRQAESFLQRFLDERLPHYLQRSEPKNQVSSELSPYLHFGQISSHQIVAQLFEQQNWSIGNLGPETKGKRRGWWGMSETAESFLDQLVTWREVGFNTAQFRPDYDQYHSLPGWARESLEKHRDDPRPYLYSFEQFEQAKTHDPLWNAVQNQLHGEGRVQNYLRMLWGKKILEWSIDAETALQTMLALNDKYALDGNDPNSISGIFWCLGRYDRAWGPERPIYGKIRYMSSENTMRKFRVKSYLQRYSVDGESIRTPHK